MAKSKMLVLTGVWVGCIIVSALGWKFIFSPMKAEKDKENQEILKKQILTETGSSGRYQHEIRLATDSFSGYAGLRSQEFSRRCGDFKIHIEAVDVPDYRQRLEAIKSGDIQMAAFSVDALIKTSAALGELPATIISVIDESYGADSMWTSTQFKDLDSLNDPATKFVLVGNSPSETLVQIVRSFFEFRRLSNDPFIRLNNPDEVIEMYRQSRADEKKVFVTWQPEALQIAKNPNYKKLIDSSQFRGYIVDVLVVSRDFLAKNEEVVFQVLQAYFSTNFDLSDKIKLVQEDGSLTVEQAKEVTSGIRWRNTQENYAHFGFVQQPGYSHIEDVITNINKVLVQSKSISSDPTGGKPRLLYYDRLIKKLFDSNFYPGSVAEKLQSEKGLVALDDSQWNSLLPVGTVQVPMLVFARGTAKLSSTSEETLEELSQQLKAWPHYFVRVQGHSQGNSPADLEIQKKRADVAVEWLINHGIDRNRIRSEASESNGSTTVKFRLGQLAY